VIYIVYSFTYFFQKKANSVPYKRNEYLNEGVVPSDASGCLRDIIIKFDVVVFVINIIY